MKKILLVTLLGLSITACQSTEEDTKKVGSTLNEKYELTLDQIPESAMSAIIKFSPEFVAKEVEKELKHGNTYLDVEGLDGKGNEIEFDMLEQENGMWKVVEIQRDLTLEQCPKIVIDALPEISPKRIIESDQTNGIVIYEFYTVADNGEEKKYEVKVENNQAELLSEEWSH